MGLRRKQEWFRRPSEVRLVELVWEPLLSRRAVGFGVSYGFIRGTRKVGIFRDKCHAMGLKSKPLAGISFTG